MNALIKHPGTYVEPSVEVVPLDSTSVVCISQIDAKEIEFDDNYQNIFNNEN